MISIDIFESCTEGIKLMYQRLSKKDALLKMIVSFSCAFILGNVACFFYSNTANSITNLDRYTTIKRKTRHYNFYGCEGYGITSTDENGFYNDGRISPEDAEILCVGSSQTEAIHVDTEENYVSRLNKYDHRAYNLGVSGSFMSENLYRLPFIPRFFSHCKIIVHETPVLPSLKEWDKIIYYLEENDAPVENLDWKNKNFLFRLFHSMPCAELIYDNIKKIFYGRTQNIDNEDSIDMSQYREKANYAMHLLQDRLGDIPLVIIYLPEYRLEKDGRLSITSDDKCKQILQEACEANHIRFVHDQLSSVIINNYEASRILPRGFLNGRAGFGHLNTEGHRMVAETLHRILQEESITR